jgi:hypothetical protein
VLAKDGAARLSDMLWNLQELKQLDEVATNFRSWKQR